MSECEGLRHLGCQEAEEVLEPPLWHRLARGARVWRQGHPEVPAAPETPGDPWGPAALGAALSCPAPRRLSKYGHFS